MVYAHAHDQTVENDYFAAMGRIEQRLHLVDQPLKIALPVTAHERSPARPWCGGQLLTLAEKLFTPDLTHELLLEIASQMRVLLVDPSEWIPPPVLKNSVIG